MDVVAHLRLLAQYNRWMNDKLYDAAGTLAPEAVTRDRGAFFKSILGTLNHLVVTDILWMHRLGTHPKGFLALAPVLRMEKPATLDLVLHHDLASLSQARHALDDVLLAWTGEIAAPDLDAVIEYQNMKGITHRKLFGSLMLNLFSHHAHHRGQATTLLAQAGADVGVTDLLALIPDAA